MAKREKDLLGLVTIGPYEARNLMGVGEDRFEKVWKMRIKDKVRYTRTTKGRRILLTDLIRVIYPDIAKNEIAVHMLAQDFVWRCNDLRKTKYGRKRQDGGD